ncbi:hypothetical protein OGZ02_16530 [Brachyspira hyodysenteriae]|nr:hypothetical protein [Brachyspira hyodysenteriae]MDA1470364.1 hypothetical protein [Brachyspira hyodysenteriae]
MDNEDNLENRVNDMIYYYRNILEQDSNNYKAMTDLGIFYTCTYGGRATCPLVSHLSGKHTASSFRIYHYCTFSSKSANMLDSFKSKNSSLYL